ncbi:MAG: NAD(P)-dependent oxidoreductase [Nanoarchaeales archaeon]|nr:NAD(P)-dependent oxidoreductase [Nanoarchaeales archaeon]
MKIFITGSSGFIGSELIKELKNSYEIVTYDISKGDDILDYDKVNSAMVGCDVVIHLAAHRKPYDDKEFKDYFDTNCIGTFNVAQAAVSNGVKKIIYSSSTSYYGCENGIPFQVPINENNLVMTQHVKVSDLKCRDCDISYSTSKVICEEILANYGLTKKLQVIILRLGPTRKKEEYRPFGDLKLHLKIENAIQLFKNSIECETELWYEAFTVCDEIENVDISKAKKLLNYNPL